MDIQTCLRSTGRSRGGVAVTAALWMLGLSAMANGQTTSTCLNNTVPNQVASAGLAEQVGNIVLNCTGGTSGNIVIASLYISLNANITNALDSNGNPTNITVTATGAAVTNNPPVLTSASTLLVGSITYTVPNPNVIPVVITIGGIRAAAATIGATSGPFLVTASLVPIGISMPGTLATVAFATPQLLSSTQNNGITCGGSPLPSTTDFNGFISAGTMSSAVRVTEAVLGALSPVSSTATNGTRILVQLTGYGAGVRLFVPSAVVGTSGSLPTTAGEFNSTIGAGIYTPTANQLMLSLVNGADQNGVGGKLVYPPPAASGSYVAMTELTVANGSAYAVYEVVDHSPFVKQAVQFPVFIVTAAGNCSAATQTSLNAFEAPISTVTVATATDPIPRYVSSSLASDCSQTGDCNANYFPVLSVSTNAVSLAGASLGLSQNATVPLLNNGGAYLDFTTSIAYQSGSGWLSVTPSTGAIGSSINAVITANPATLQPGTYSATVTINGGTAGTVAIPVTFTVGPPGVALQALVNAASFATGPVSPGSYVALYGLNLTGVGATPATPIITFNGITVNALYTSATQLNLIVPASLSGATTLAVVVAVGGQTSNTLNVALSPNVLGIFTPGILNSDSTVNSVSNPAARGTFIQVYLTGLAVPVAGNVTVNIGSQTGITPFPGQTYVQPTYPALDQVNVNVPASLAATGSLPLAVCVTAPPSPQACSNSVNVFVK